MTKLHVGNLPRDTGRPRGLGFIEMSNADASRAMQALNGQDFEGRALKINEAQDRAGGGGWGVGLVVLGERELGVAMANYALTCFGWPTSLRQPASAPPSATES